MGIKNEFSACSSFDDKSRRLMLSIIGGHQFTAVSDGGHQGLAGECLFADSGFITGLSKLGIKHIFLEIDEARQGDLEAFYEDRVTVEDLLEKVGHTAALTNEEQKSQKELEADFFTYAKDNGIKIHFVDPKPAIIDENPFLSRIYSRIAAAIMDGNISTEDEVARIADSYGLSLEEIKEYQNTLLKQRDMANYKIAESIDRLSGSDKALIMYGSLHLGTSDNQIPTLLGRDRVVVIHMDTPDSVGVDGADYNFEPDKGTLNRTLKGLFRFLPASDENFHIPPKQSEELTHEQSSGFEGNYILSR